MRDMHTGTGARAASGLDGSRAASFRAADWLGLAAAPTFTLMAWLTNAPAGGPMEMLCPAVHAASPLNGMALMYGLMAVFHSGSWLRLIARRRHAGRRR